MAEQPTDLNAQAAALSDHDRDAALESARLALRFMLDNNQE